MLNDKMAVLNGFCETTTTQSNEGYDDIDEWQHLHIKCVFKNTVYKGSKMNAFLTIVHFKISIWP